MDNFLNEDERIDDLEIKGLKLIQKKNDYCSDIWLDIFIFTCNWI